MTCEFASAYRNRAVEIVDHAAARLDGAGGHHGRYMMPVAGKSSASLDAPGVQRGGRAPSFGDTIRRSPYQRGSRTGAGTDSKLE